MVVVVMTTLSGWEGAMQLATDAESRSLAPSDPVT